MIEIIQYSFFQNALIGWILISLTASILGTFVVMRKEANVTHSIANFLFLWIAISLLSSANYYIFTFLFAIIASFVIFYIEKTNFISKESTKEIISQAWIAWGIFTIWFVWNLSLDINNFLFWSILFINKTDILLLSVFALLCYFLFFFFKENFLSIIINQDIAKSKWIKVDIYNILFLIFLSIFVAISIKIFGILLIWAFLIIPANTAKLISSSLKLVFIISIILSFISVIIWLFASYYLETSSWATIVLILLIFFISALIYKNTRN